MKRATYMITFFVFILYGCCESTLTDSYFLNNDQKAIAPYQHGSNLSFVTNKGYEFDIEIEKIDTFMHPVNWGEESCNYVDYETIEMGLRSIHPEMDIDIVVMATEQGIFNYIECFFTLNNQCFYPPKHLVPSGIEDILQDTVVDGQSYNDVIVLTNGMQNCQGDTSLVCYEHILFSPEFGIELITLTSGDYYELKK